MIRMTKQTDYGIVLMTHLAGDADGQHSAPELAAGLRIPLPMVSKILKVLTREGLLVSQRGVRGGYALARAPEAISVAEIIEALEGPIAMTECVELPAGGHGDCSREPFCAVRSNWQVINRAVERALHDLTLAEMAHPLAMAPAGGLVRLATRRQEPPSVEQELA